MLTIYTKYPPPTPPSSSILCPKCQMVCANECELDCPRCDRLIPTDLSKGAMVDGVRHHIDCAYEIIGAIAEAAGKPAAIGVGK